MAVKCRPWRSAFRPRGAGVNCAAVRSRALLSLADPLPTFANLDSRQRSRRSCSRVPAIQFMPRVHYITSGMSGLRGGVFPRGSTRCILQRQPARQLRVADPRENVATRGDNARHFPRGAPR
jgi:hypothetical protein